MSKVDLHIVSWNRPHMTELVIQTIHRNTKPDNFLLEVVDNGSDEETTEMLQLLYDNGKIDQLVLLAKNAGLESARQSLFSRFTYGDYFVDIDNDCLPPPIFNGLDWLERLVELMQRYEDYAAIACRTQVMIGTGNIFEDESKDVTDFPHPGGSLRMMDGKAIKKVGGWQRKMPGRGQEEKYICGKLHDAGYKTGFATHIPTLHLFGTRGDDETDRWGYNKDLKPEDTGHSDIWHPALGAGDDLLAVDTYAGRELTERYFNVDRSNKKI